MINKNKVQWLDRGWFPFYYGFCPNEIAWKREMKRFKSNEPYPKSDGRATVFENGKGEMSIIVTIKENANDAAVMGLIVHEVIHIKQYLMKHLNESNPGVEIEAYACQAIFMCIMDAYAKTRHTDKLAVT